jgi:hypothetical protein
MCKARMQPKWQRAAQSGCKGWLLPTPWKQPRVNWEASWLAHPVRLAEGLMKPLTLAKTANGARLPHALKGPYGGSSSKKQVYCAMQQ